MSKKDKDKEKAAANPEPKKEQTQAQDVSEQETPKEENNQISDLMDEIEAVKQAHVRTLAEYDNYRKRSTREKQAAYADAKAACLTQLLPVLDNFDRALSAQDSDFESFKKGMEMIHNDFNVILEKLGVESFGEVGEKFDPNIHNGVMHIEDENLDESVIAEVLSKGYRLSDKILRPAMVKVAN